MTTPWHSLGIAEIEAELKAGPKDFPPNTLVDKALTHWSLLLLRQFASLLVLILAFAAILSFFVGDKVDALAIIAIIILNAALGFVQEWRAEAALKNLKKMLFPRCRVVRDGLVYEVDATTLVPGDHVLLASGNAVPADLRLTSVTNMRIDESTLTGESEATEKTVEPLPEQTPVANRRNMAFMGTHVVNGHGEAVVVATGMDTEFGRIASLTGSIRDTKTNLQKQLAVLARQLGALAVVVSLFVFFIGWLSGHDAAQMAMTGISLAVAAVPEGLPAVVTVTLALGMGMMARKKALLRHLQAAETLGAVSVICTDKTGTLTLNEMMVQKIWLPGVGVQGQDIDVSGAGYDPDGNFSINGNVIVPKDNFGLMTLLSAGQKCNHASVEKTEQGWRAIGSATESSLIVVAKKAGLGDVVEDEIVVAEYSFNSIRKRMTVVLSKENVLTAYIKGAPESILSRSTHVLVDGHVVPMTPAMRRHIESVYTAYAKEGLRTLSVAQKSLPTGVILSEDIAETDIVFLGIEGVIDPPRPEVNDALRRAQAAGIRVIVITGDSPDTALAVAKQVGLRVERGVTGQDMAEMTDDALAALLAQDILFARVVPEDKFRIVSVLQAQNQLVAMTGDGVNDAPALKKADIGIAMGIRGTDVAKGAADIVLTDDNFATIIAAIEEGRRQYTNIRKFVQFLIAHNTGEIVTIFTNILLGGPLILLPIQILWVNLATDSVTALALSVEKKENNIMAEPPRKIDQNLIDRKAIIYLAGFGLYIGLATLALFHIYVGQSYDLANTVAFTMIVITAQILVLSFRHMSGPVFVIGWFSNPGVLIASAAMIAMQMAAVYNPVLQEVLHTVPLPLEIWGVMIAASLPLFIVPELYKIWVYKRRA